MPENNQYQKGSRELLEEIIQKHREVCEKQPSSKNSVFLTLSRYDFTSVDLRGFLFGELDIIEFDECKFSRILLDRVSLLFLRTQFTQNNIMYDSLIFDDSYLGPQTVENHNIGVKYISYCNLSNMKLSESSFQRCNLRNAFFDESDISNCNFTDAINFTAEQFINCINFYTSRFFRDEKENNSFIEKIEKLSLKQNNSPHQYRPHSHHVIAELLEPFDKIRLDDPYFERNKDQ